MEKQKVLLLVCFHPLASEGSRDATVVGAEKHIWQWLWYQIAKGRALSATWSRPYVKRAGGR